MSQLGKIVNEKATPKVEAHKVRGQEVKPIDARPLGDLELAKLSDLLKEYEKKWEAMGEASAFKRSRALPPALPNPILQPQYSQS